MKLSDVVVYATELIEPPHEQEARCHDIIEQRLEMLRDVHRRQAAISSPGELKKQLQNIDRDLRRMRRSLERWPSATDVVFDQDAIKKQPFFDQIDLLINSTKFYGQAIASAPGGHRWNNMKALSARLAYELLITFGIKPTKTAEGTFSVSPHCCGRVSLAKRTPILSSIAATCLTTSTNPVVVA